MTTSLSYKRTDGNGIEWNYVTSAPCVYVLDLPHLTIPGGFCNKWFAIAPTVTDGKQTITVTIAPNYAWDGASVVPDYPGTLEASLPHDAIYQFADAVAKAWGWSVWQVLRFADTVFNLVMAYYKVNPFLRLTYYTGVLTFGWFYNRGAKLYRTIAGV